MTAKAIATARGCGTRAGGGIYAEVGVDGGGLPIDHFLFCPPFRLVPDALQALGITALGVTLVERQGVWHIFDVVGREHYPNVADFIEEARRFGISRRLSRSLEFAKLTSASRLFLLHARAWNRNAWDYYQAMPFISSDGSPYTVVKPCPKAIPAHNKIHEPPTMCAQLWWQDVTGGEDVQSENAKRQVKRTMPSFSYRAAKAPDGMQAEYDTAIFASFPLSRIVVIRDGYGSDQQAYDRASQVHDIPVEFENE